MAKNNGEAPATPAAPVERKPTSYVVLERVVQEDGRDAWTEVQTLDAKNASEAEKKAAVKLGPGDGQYKEGDFKAVAASAWNGGQHFYNESKPQPKSRPLNGASIEARVTEGASA